jgi:hypothetical protein
MWTERVNPFCMNLLLLDKPVDNCSAHSSDTNSIETSNLRHHLLAVGEQKRSGIILCKEHYAEFAGPGAAINSSVDQSYALILAIGSPEIIQVDTHEERQRAYGRRIQWVRWLHKIVSHADPLQRTEKLLAGFEEFFGSEILARIPVEVLSLLAGVLPQTVTLVQSQSHFSGGIISVPLHSFTEDENVSLIRLGSQSPHPLPIKPSICPSYLDSFAAAFPCSA